MRELLQRYPNITATRMFEELAKLGYKGRYSLVRDRVRELRSRPIKPLTVRFETGPGEQAQMDWSTYEIPFTEEGRRKVNAFSYVLAYSRRQYVSFTERPFQYIEGNLLNGRAFRSLEHLNEVARCWLSEIADRRQHGTTRKTPLELHAEELPHLLPMLHQGTMKSNCNASASDTPSLAKRARASWKGCCRNSVAANIRRPRCWHCCKPIPKRTCSRRCPGPSPTTLMASLLWKESSHIQARQRLAGSKSASPSSGRSYGLRKPSPLGHGIAANTRT